MASRGVGTLVQGVLIRAPVLKTKTLKNRTPARFVGHPLGHDGANTRKGTPMKIRPLQDRLIVKRVAEENKTKGGIIIPDSAKEKPLEGKVIAVGNGKILEDGKVRALDIKAGDTILFSKYAGTEVKIEGEDHLILREEDVLGVIEK
jgi:chaperonin GroES